jgi:hypothetical protein
VVVDVSLAGVFMVLVLVGHMTVLQGGMVVFMLVSGAEVLESAGHLIVVVSNVEVPVAMGDRCVLMLLPCRRRGVLSHLRSS